MDESNSQPGNGQSERRYNPELLKKGLHCDLDQYDFLNECSEKGEEGIKAWNEWRLTKENRHKDIELEGAGLAGCYLKGIHLELTGFERLGEWAERKARSEVYLRNADLVSANLQGAALMDTHLEGAKLWFAHLENADISFAHLESTECQQAIVDGTTTLWECKVDRKTDFLGVSLDVAKIDPGTKQLLEYNIRRKNWDKWYQTRPWWWRRPIRYFWTLSDYGTSTLLIIKAFFVMAMVFAIVYYCWGAIDYYILHADGQPGIVSNLFTDESGEAILWWLVPLRSIYFSVVTMTTLGFGDMYANAQNYWWGWLGHMLLMLQVILGYVLMGALVTRFAVLFTAGGPAGRFADEKKDNDEE